MNGGGDEILGFHIRRHGLDHGGCICADHHHPCLGDIGVSVKHHPVPSYGGRSARTLATGEGRHHLSVPPLPCSCSAAASRLDAAFHSAAAARSGRALPSASCGWCLFA